MFNPITINTSKAWSDPITGVANTLTEAQAMCAREHVEWAEIRPVARPLDIIARLWPGTNDEAVFSALIEWSKQ